jgi:hypothetical protein
MLHNILSLQRDWYVTQVGHLDPRVHRLPMPDSLMGRLVQFVVAHEVGHSLGLPHNMKASSMYPLDSIRSPTWVARMGHSPSIMDYSRFNYVAQPEDRIPLAHLIPSIGPYDRYAVRWGYAPIAGATTPRPSRPRSTGGRGCRTASPGSASRGAPTRRAPIPARPTRRWATPTPCAPPRSASRTSRASRG